MSEELLVDLLISEMLFHLAWITASVAGSHRGITGVAERTPFIPFLFAIASAIIFGIIKDPEVTGLLEHFLAGCTHACESVAAYLAGLAPTSFYRRYLEHPLA